MNLLSQFPKGKIVNLISRKRFQEFHRVILSVVKANSSFECSKGKHFIIWMPCQGHYRTLDIFVICREIAFGVRDSGQVEETHLMGADGDSGKKKNKFNW